VAIPKIWVVAVFLFCFACMRIYMTKLFEFLIEGRDAYGNGDKSFQ
jgi:hypothetical protein